MGEGKTHEDAQPVLLCGVAEEAHEHRHFCMSCGRSREAFAMPCSSSSLADARHLGSSNGTNELGGRGDWRRGGGCGRNLHYLAKKRPLAAVPAVPSPCPALRSGIDLPVIPACRSHRRLGHRGLRWYVWLLRCRTSV